MEMPASLCPPHPPTTVDTFQYMADNSWPPEVLFPLTLWYCFCSRATCGIRLRLDFSRSYISAWLCFLHFFFFSSLPCRLVMCFSFCFSESAPSTNQLHESPHAKLYFSGAQFNIVTNPEA